MLSQAESLNESIILLEEDGTRVVIPMSRCATDPEEKGEDGRQSDSCQSCSSCLFAGSKAFVSQTSFQIIEPRLEYTLKYSKVPLWIGQLLRSNLPVRAPPVRFS